MERQGSRAARRYLLALAIVIAGRAVGPALASDAPEDVPPVGIARMLPDGTIIMDLFQNDHVATAEGRFTYHRSDRAYKDVIEHLHGLKPGERKAVPPWPLGEGGPH